MKKVCIIIVLLSVFCVGCKTYCPEFPAELNYFPYYEGLELRFMNTQDVVRSFTITNKETSKVHSFGQSCRCVCWVNTFFSTNPNQDSLSIGSEIYFLGGEEENVAGIHINSEFQNNRGRDFLTGTLDIEKPVPYTELYKYLEDTITIENENNQIVKKIVIVKGKGLVSYTTADGEEWKLVE